jgi:uncharacterized protein
MTFLDTGYLIALSRKEDALHERAVAWGRVLPGPFSTTEYVLCEFVNAMSAPEDRPAAHLLLDRLRTHPRIDIVWATPDSFQAGLDLHRNRADKRWSLTDCISFSVMTQRGVRDALTHDHHFEQAGFRALLRHDAP